MRNLSADDKVKLPALEDVLAVQSQKISKNTDLAPPNPNRKIFKSKERNISNSVLN